MKVYLAAPYAARALLNEYAAELRHIGIAVTSTWLDGTHELDAEHTATHEDRQRWATEDLADVRRSDLLVAFTAAAVGIQPPRGTSGGRHVETGYALGRNISVLLVGETEENVFHSLAYRREPNWHAALVEISRRFAAPRQPMAASA